MSQLLLDVNGLTMRFGGLVAVNQGEPCGKKPPDRIDHWP